MLSFIASSSWLMRAPELPANYERIVQELEAKENGDGQRR